MKVPGEAPQLLRSEAPRVPGGPRLRAGGAGPHDGGRGGFGARVRPAPDGTYPSGTTQYEKRNTAIDIPVWDPATCVQCGKCLPRCAPHAAIRSKVYEPQLLEGAPETFKSTGTPSGRTSRG